MTRDDEGFLNFDDENITATETENMINRNRDQL